MAGDTNGRPELFIHNPATGTTQAMSLFTRFASPFTPTQTDAHGLSADGRVFAFSSTLTNLIVEDTNNTRDVFVRSPLG